MATRTHLLPLAILLLVLAPAASAASWRRITSATDKRPWKVDVLPSGIGYAAPTASDKFSAFNGTQDGGNTWKTLVAAPKGVSPTHFETVGTGNAILAFYSEAGQEKTLLWTDASKKWTNQTVEAPKGKKSSHTELAQIERVPGLTQAFAAGSVETTDGSIVPGAWYWNGGAAWKFSQTSKFVEGLSVASPTAAWLSFSKPGDVLRWSGTAWVQLRKGAADESVQLLKAVPATTTTAAQTWALLSKEANGRKSETLMQCDYTKCTAKRAAATFGTYPGSFQSYRGFDASGPSFALVWERQPSNNPNLTNVYLQQFNGASWSTALKTVVRLMNNGPAQPWGQPTITSPQLYLSVASPTRAVAALLHMPPAGSTKATLETHTWNGAKWTQQANATFTRDEIGTYPNPQLQALNSGSALLSWASGMRRLA